VEGDFVDALKNGVLLCEVMNVIQPGIIASYSKTPKHYLEDKARPLQSVSITAL